MDWLTREQIDQVIEQLSADDLIEATDAAGGKGGARVAGIAFHHAALRVLGPSEQSWTTRVRATDFSYLASQMGEAINVGSPLSEDTSGLLDSPEPGEDSPPLT